MLIEDLRRYADELGRLTTGALTQPKMVRLVEVLERLGGLAPQADRLLRTARYTLAGDLWPEVEADDEDSEEEVEMNERERLVMFRDVTEDSGVVKSARQDALTRLEDHFADQDVDRIAARDHVERTLRHQAPHFWPQPSTLSTPLRPATTAGPDKPRRPQPVALTAAQEAEAMKLPPAQRLTYYRERQQEAQERR